MPSAGARYATNPRYALPPETIAIDRSSGRFQVIAPAPGTPPVFSYDAFPIFWRVALDARWFVTREGPLRARMLRFFQKEWKTNRRFLDRYSPEGQPLSNQEGLPLYARILRDPEGGDRYVKVHTQSNPLMLCLRPRSVVKCTKV